MNTRREAGSACGQQHAPSTTSPHSRLLVLGRQEDNAVMRSAMALLSAWVCWTSALSFAADAPRLVQTTIHGVLTLQGKPVANRLISSCEDGLRTQPGHRAEAACASPIRTRTNQRGEFSFQQIGGVLPPERPISVGDPRYSYWFEVRDGGRPKWFIATGMGWAQSEIDLRCEIRPPRAPGETLQQYRQRDLLNCKAQGPSSVTIWSGQ